MIYKIIETQSHWIAVNRNKIFQSVYMLGQSKRVKYMQTLKFNVSYELSAYLFSIIWTRDVESSKIKHSLDVKARTIWTSILLFYSINILD